jgi:hypothetical protein
MDLPTSKASPSELATFLRANSGAIAAAKGRADELHRRAVAHCLRQDAAQALNIDWQRLRGAMTEAMRPRQLTGAQAEQALVDQLRVALTAAERMEFYAEMTEERWQAGLEQARVRAMADAAELAAATAPAFDARAFITALARRGIALGTGDGKITAGPGHLLTGADRAVLHAHRDEILAALAADMEAF